MSSAALHMHIGNEGYIQLQIKLKLTYLDKEIMNKFDTPIDAFVIGRDIRFERTDNALRLPRRPANEHLE